MASGLRYPGKVVIVTGATRGIGEGIVREFVFQGAKVVFCAPECEEKQGKAIEQELHDCGAAGEAHFQICDVRCEEAIQNLVAVTIEYYGCLDCLVNNVGVHPPYKTIDDFTAQEFRDIMEINTVSYFLASKYALPYLRKTKGNIVNISSIVNIIGDKLSLTYAATKGAVTAMTKALAIDESKHCVRVNCISPANIWTPLWGRLASETPDPAATIQQGKDAQLLGRMGTPAEIAKAALYLAADATFCTGFDLVLSGGAELGYGHKSPFTSGCDSKN
ncbi:17-beta-hydroxysteroid dehydrogenase 14 [Anolis carolinensis]|uniref:17-beta-hydroxysteroid dehydrogenase 14 n=1 Tax=Anolis carolinensis TaxID=28377 RepID=H9GP32_ANOCA|nr:PREDICTED: 17-beta-hydroxysteroid dehydrogenase 14 [Anolis carolinensis]|eukprot:XP_016852195.1 PREDICTED: 17-beta-hydroxysteroid dehydrogenase 14 [Anolis carolinensis]